MLGARLAQPALLAMITEEGGSPCEERKIKTTSAMEKLLTSIEAIVLRLRAEAEAAAKTGSNAEASEAVSSTMANFEAVRQVLSAHPFHGINRKAQIKPTAWRNVGGEGESKEDEAEEAEEQEGHRAAGSAAGSRGSVDAAAGAARRRHDEIGTSPLSSPQGERPKPQRPSGRFSALRVPTMALFVLKWGGELTPLGETQATTLGAKARYSLYPGEENGVLRLHASYRHDLKVYSSDEGRVQMTAAAFAKGFLALEGELTPILASLVSKNKAVTKMLDETAEEGLAQMSMAKQAIHTVLTSGLPLSDDGEYIAASTNRSARRSAELRAMRVEVRAAEEEARVTAELAAYRAAAAAEAAAADEPAESALPAGKGRRLSETMPLEPLLNAIERSDDDPLFSHTALGAIGPPLDALATLHRLVNVLTAELYERAAPFLQPGSSLPPPEAVPALGETAHLQFNRWAKLQGEFYRAKKDQFDTTKIPDLCAPAHMPAERRHV
jgi:hypothetical protein